MIWMNKSNIDAATITASTENASYKFSDALTDYRLSRRGRTTAISGQYIDIAFTVAQAVDYFAMLADNLTSTAVITLSANTVDDLDNPVVTYTIIDKEWTVLADLGDVTLTEFLLEDENGDYIVDENGDNISGYTSFSEYQYWRVSITDTANTNGYLEIAKIFLGEGLQLPYMAKTQKIPTASTSTVTDSPMGQTYGDAGYFYRYGTVTFPFVSDDERADIDEFFRVVDKFRPALIIIWPDDTDIEPPIYARFTSDMDFSRVEASVGREWSLQFGFREMF
jgi:hypothetical protein